MRTAIFLLPTLARARVVLANLQGTPVALVPGIMPRRALHRPELEYFEGRKQRGATRKIRSCCFCSWGSTRTRTSG